MLASFISACTDDCCTGWAITIWPDSSLNRALTLAIPRCRPVATADECAGSMIHGPGGGGWFGPPAGVSEISPSEPEPFAPIWAVRAVGLSPAPVTTAV